MSPVRIYSFFSSISSISFNSPMIHIGQQLGISIPFSVKSFVSPKFSVAMSVYKHYSSSASKGNRIDSIKSPQRISPLKIYIHHSSPKSFTQSSSNSFVSSLSLHLVNWLSHGFTQSLSIKITSFS